LPNYKTKANYTTYVISKNSLSQNVPGNGMKIICWKTKKSI